MNNNEQITKSQIFFVCKRKITVHLICYRSFVPVVHFVTIGPVWMTEVSNQTVLPVSLLKIIHTPGKNLFIYLFIFII